MLCGIGSDADSWRDQALALNGTALVAEGDTIDAMAERMLADAPPRFALAGQSMGGYVALAMALAAPDRVERLAIVNSSAAADSEEQQRTRMRIVAKIEAEGLAPLLTLLPPLLSRDPDVQQRSADMMRRAGAERIAREYLACASRPDRRPALGTLAMPLFVIGTQDDTIVPSAAAEDMARLVPGARIHLLSDGGHLSPMTKSGVVTGLMRDWQS
jgi:pimeloyl-ACP methyl ester carboxylesterase